jgi:hypothetical protein
LAPPAPAVYTVAPAVPVAQAVPVHAPPLPRATNLGKPNAGAVWAAARPKRPLVQSPATVATKRQHGDAGVPQEVVDRMEAELVELRRKYAALQAATAARVHEVQALTSVAESSAVTRMRTEMQQRLGEEAAKLEQQRKAAAEAAAAHEAALEEMRAAVAAAQRAQMEAVQHAAQTDVAAAALAASDRAEVEAAAAAAKSHALQRWRVPALERKLERAEARAAAAEGQQQKAAGVAARKAAAAEKEAERRVAQAVEAGNLELVALEKRLERDRRKHAAADARKHAAECAADERDRVELSAMLSRIADENERLRDRCSRGRTAEVAQQCSEQEEAIEKLSERRANNMGATSLLNLERRRVEVLKLEVNELRDAIRDNWGKETLELAEQALELPRVRAELAALKSSLDDADIEAGELRRVVQPPPPMERGAFDMKTRFAIMKLIAIANVCHTRVPAVITIMAEHFGVRLPARERAILVSAIDGHRKYERKLVQWVPSAGTCENIRSEMGPLSQLQVGEAIIAAGGSDGNFAVHSDAASSEGRELSGYVLGYRPPVREGEPSRIQNLLFDIRWAMDKTAATRAKDFRAICHDVAALCKKAEMAETEKIATLKPTAAMNDRANAELCAARLMTESDHVNPTCGEHGAAVNPMSACTKAMDGVVRGWMGKSEASLALEAHKVRALHMAVGWNTSPSGALIYCVSKYAATHSDKGYAVGQDARGFNEHLALLNGDDRQSILALGHMEDLLSIKGSRSYVSMLNAPIVDRILHDFPGSFYQFLKEQEELAKPGGGRIRTQIIAGAESPETRACVRAEAIVGAFFGWPILRAIKHRPADGSDPHILDMAPIYQEAHAQLLKAKDTPRLVATNQIKLLPSYPHLYPQSEAGERTKDARVKTDMQRIYSECENCTRIEELLSAGLKALADKFFEHTRELQLGGSLTGVNVTPELRAKLAGVNRTNTVVESVFALEKFLSTREKGSNLVYRRGWTLFKCAPLPPLSLLSPPRSDATPPLPNSGTTRRGRGASSSTTASSGSTAR